MGHAWSNGAASPGVALVHFGALACLCCAPVCTTTALPALAQAEALSTMATTAARSAPGGTAAADMSKHIAAAATTSLSTTNAAVATPFTCPDGKFAMATSAPVEYKRVVGEGSCRDAAHKTPRISWNTTNPSTIRDCEDVCTALLAACVGYDFGVSGRYSGNCYVYGSALQDNGMGEPLYGWNFYNGSGGSDTLIQGNGFSGIECYAKRPAPVEYKRVVGEGSCRDAAHKTPRISWNTTNPSTIRDCEDVCTALLAACVGYDFGVSGRYSGNCYVYGSALQDNGMGEPLYGWNFYNGSGGSDTLIQGNGFSGIECYAKRPVGEMSIVCVEHQTCTEEQYTSTAPTPTSDRVCIVLKVCMPGSEVAMRPTATSDRQCAPCDGQHYSDAINQPECTLKTKCPPDTQYETVNYADKNTHCIPTTHATATTATEITTTTTTHPDGGHAAEEGGLLGTKVIILVVFLALTTACVSVGTVWHHWHRDAAGRALRHVARPDKDAHDTIPMLFVQAMDPSLDTDSPPRLHTYPQPNVEATTHHQNAKATTHHPSTLPLDRSPHHAWPTCHQDGSLPLHRTTQGIAMVSLWTSVFCSLSSVHVYARLVLHCGK